MLMAALQYANTPGYSAIIFRRTYTDLALSGALMDRAADWLSGTGAHWSGETKTWTFPSGATLSFGYLEHEQDKLRYKSSEFQFVGFDELTDFSETQYTYLFSRQRRLKGSNIPIRMRAATNPGGPGHEWVRKRFVPDDYIHAPPEEQFAKPWYKQGRAFVPARLEDNEHLDQEEYRESLSNLEPVTRKQLEEGDWTAHAGGRFRKEWFRTYRDLGDAWLLEGEPYHKTQTRRVVTLDPANRKTKSSKFTAMGAFADVGKQRLLVLEIQRERLTLEQICPRLHGLCSRWSPQWAGIEANGFQIAIVNEARDKTRYPNIPTVLELDPEGKSKLTRATPAIIRAEQGLIYLPEEAPWLEEFVGEMCQFTGDEKEDTYTDQVDIMAYAVLGLDKHRPTARPVPGKTRVRHR